MNRAQRIVLAIYSLVLSYCCVWIPWQVQIHVPSESRHLAGYVRVGYGWLWAGPTNPDGGYWKAVDESHGDPFEMPLNLAPLRSPYSRQFEYAAPDIPLIGLRLIALSSIAAAGLLLTGMRWRAATR